MTVFVMLNEGLSSSDSEQTPARSLQTGSAPCVLRNCTCLFRRIKEAQEHTYVSKVILHTHACTQFLCNEYHTVRSLLPIVFST